MVHLYTHNTRHFLHTPLQIHTYTHTHTHTNERERDKGRDEEETGEMKVSYEWGQDQAYYELLI